MKRTAHTSLFFLTILSVALIAGCTGAPRLTYLTQPEKTQKQTTPIDLERLERLYGDYDGVYLSREFSAEHAGFKEDIGQSIGVNLFGLGNKWTFSMVHRDRYVILNPEADWLTTIRLSAKPDNFFLQVISPEGNIRNYTMTDFRTEKDDNGYDDYAFVIPDVKKGTLVDYGYDYSYNVPITNPPLEFERYLQYTIPCEHVTFSYLYPEWWNINVKKTAPGTAPKSQIVYDPDHKKKSLVITKTNIPAVEDEPFSPFFKEMADYIQLRIVDLEMKGATLNKITSWEQYTERFRKYTLKKLGKKDRLLKETFDRVVADAPTRRDSALAILRFVRDSIDTGGKFQKGNANKTLKDRGGSIFDITGLAQTLLRYGNFDARYVLVHSAEDGYFDQMFFSGEQLYTPAVALMFSTDTLIALPYVKHIPLDYTPKRYQGQMALVIADKEAAFQSFVTPTGSLIDNTHEEAYTLNINEDGLIDVTETKTYRGVFAYHWREFFRLTKKDELKKELEDMLEYQEGDVALADYKLVNNDDDSKPLIVNLHYTIDNLVTVTPEEVIFKTSGLLSPLSEKQSKSEKKERHNPIHIYFDRVYKKSIAVTFPESWHISTPLDTVAFSNAIGSAESAFQLTGNTLEINQSVNLTHVALPKDSFPDLNALIGASSALDLQTIVFEVGQAKSETSSDNVSK